MIEILVYSLHSWPRIGHHLSLTPAVCYGLVKIAASYYWMFLHPITGCLSNYWITSNSWNLAQTDIGNLGKIFGNFLKHLSAKLTWTCLICSAACIHHIQQLLAGKEQLDSRVTEDYSSFQPLGFAESYYVVLCLVNTKSKFLLKFIYKLNLGPMYCLNIVNARTL